MVGAKDTEIGAASLQPEFLPTGRHIKWKTFLQIIAVLNVSAG
jgi:hypothetical protein